MPVTNLPSIKQEMVRYGMSIYFTLGIVGNICNCIMFTRPIYRRSASSIYLLSLSIFDIMYLIWSMFPLFYTLNHTDLQSQSLFYCKMRLYISHILGQCIRYVVVFACIDRYIVSQPNTRLRSLNSVQMALKLVLIMCIVWSVAALHIPILIDIRDGICGMFDLYQLVYGFYRIILSGILPPVLMSIFGVLTIRSLHQRHGARKHARQRDRYLMRMLIAEVVVNIFTSIPFSANLIYGVV